jgi:hypothetical protein
VQINWKSITLNMYMQVWLCFQFIYCGTWMMGTQEYKTTAKKAKFVIKSRRPPKKLPLAQDILNYT